MNNINENMIIIIMTTTTMNSHAYSMAKVQMAGSWPAQVNLYLLNMTNHCNQNEEWVTMICKVTAKK